MSVIGREDPDVVPEAVLEVYELIAVVSDWFKVFQEKFSSKEGRLID